VARDTLAPRRPRARRRRVSLAQHALVLLAIRSVKRAMRIVGSHNEPLAGGPSQAAASPIPTTFWWPRAPASPSASGLRLVSRLRFRDGNLRSLPVPAPPIRPHRPGQRHRPVPNTQRLPFHSRRLCDAPSPGPLRAAAGGAASPVTSKPRSPSPQATRYSLLGVCFGRAVNACLLGCSAGRWR